MNRISLRLRLLAAWAVFIALTLQVVGLGLRVLYERSITGRTTNELSADLRQLRRGMEIGADGAVAVVREPTDPQFDIVFGGRYWQIDEGSKTLLRSRSLNEFRIDVPKTLIVAEDIQTTRLVGPEDQKLYAVLRAHPLPRSASGDRRVLTIITAVDASEIQDDTDKFASDLFSSLSGLAIMLLIGAWAHVTIGLAPLETLRGRVADVRAGKTHHIEGDYPDEVMPLVAETNALLDAQDSALKSARERAGDLAHGLNTPLAVMAAKSRLLKSKGEQEIAGEIDRQIEAMQHHVERELARARARGPIRGGMTTVDAALLSRNLITAIDSLPRNVPIDWLDDLPDTLAMAIDADDFNNMAGNLLENAYKWAKSRIRLTAHKKPEGTALVIEDDGPGVPEDQIARVLLRGERADTTVAGSGLGLAIVNDLVELYRGVFTLSRSELGGLRAEILLPH